MSKNIITIEGNLGSDPQFRTTKNGTPVANFSVATNTFKGQGPNRVENTQWHKIVAWRQNAKLVNAKLHKGSRVYLQGSLEYNHWIDRNGNPRTDAEIVVNFVTPVSQFKE